MRKLIIILALAGCTPAQEQQAIMIAASGLPCYEAIAASTTSGTQPIKILNGAAVAALNPACAALDQATLTLIASAINAKAPVQVAPAATPASAPAVGPIPHARKG
jgi:hypothetical protein